MKASTTKPLVVIVLILLVDQILKTWVRTHMYLGQEIKLIGNRILLHYTENNGMAFGLEFGGEAGKYALTLFRIGAVVGIGYGLFYLIRHKYHRGLIMNVALIMAGAIGNIIDSTFYGLIYKYAPLFQGRVVDMFYCPILQGHYPTWFPIWAGEDFTFFRPVFNVADSAISVGVIAILIWQKSYFKDKIEEEPTPNSEVVEE